MNTALLIGRLTRDPEIKSGAATFTLAINRAPDKNGDIKADFIRCVAFGKTAENVVRYLTKGRLVAVEGRIQTGSYQNKDGQTVYTTDVVCSRGEFLEKAAKEPAPEGFTELDEDIPF